MTDYGVQPTGYVRKPIGVLLAELEAAMVTEFGPGVVQTEVSPFGQLNGLMADILNEVDERNLELYQSVDPDQAEGKRLDTLGRLRLAYRGTRTEDQYRKAITNAGQGRIDLLDIELALRSITGVTYAKVFEGLEWLENGVLSIAVIGGDDFQIADAIRPYIVPGIGTYGNYRVSSTSTGRCRSFSIVRPIETDINLLIKVRVGPGLGGCPPPSTTAIRDALVDGWMASRENGGSLTHFAIRTLIESKWPNVELVSFTAAGSEIVGVENSTFPIAFIEIAKLTIENTEVVYV